MKNDCRWSAPAMQPLTVNQAGFWMLQLPDGSKVEVFGPDSPSTATSPPARSSGFWWMTSRTRPPSCGPPGAEILLESEIDDSGNAWVHFPAPDGNVYEFTQDPAVSWPH